MNCIIPGANMKVFHKAIQALHRLSEELYIECKPESLSLVATNMNKTAYSRYNFNQIFFLTYKVNEFESQASTGAPNLTCKVYMKPMLNVFKPKMERKIEFCKIELDTEATKIVFTLKYKHEFTMVHNVKLLDFEYLTLKYSIDDATNNITANGQFLNGIISNFQMSDVDLCLEVEEDKAVIRNYDISGAYKGMRTQIVLVKSEFITYNIRESTSILPSLKSFRSAIYFAEHFNLDVSLYFKVGGKPVIIIMKNPTFNVEYIISTVNPDGFTQATTVTAVTEPQLKKNNVTIDDRLVMENWENDFQSNSADIRCSLTNVLKTLKRNGEDGSKEQEQIKRTKKGNELFEQMDEDVENILPDASVLNKLNTTAEEICGRCFDPTLHASMIVMGSDIAPNSDSEDDDT